MLVNRQISSIEMNSFYNAGLFFTYFEVFFSRVIHYLSDEAFLTTTVLIHASRMININQEENFNFLGVIGKQKGGIIKSEQHSNEFFRYKLGHEMISIDIYFYSLLPLKFVFFFSVSLCSIFIPVTNKLSFVTCFCCVLSG